MWAEFILNLTLIRKLFYTKEDGLLQHLIIAKGFVSCDDRTCMCNWHFFFPFAIEFQGKIFNTEL
jgi:hypothetical protein